MNHLTKIRSTSLIGAAMTSKRVALCNQKELEDKLKYIFTLVGLKKLPDVIETKILIDFIIHDLKKFRLEEFVFAFKMAVKGDLNVDIDHYHNFSVKYLCEVMNAYEQSEQRHKEIRDGKLNQLPQHAQKSDSEKQKAIDDDIRGAFEYYKKTNEMPLVCAWMYTELENSGAFVHAIEFKREIFLKAQDILKSRLKGPLSAKDSIGAKEIGKRLQNLEKDGELKSIARELGLKHYWDEQIKNQTK